MTPEDVKQYLEKIYQVKILQVTTEEIRNESKINCLIALANSTQGFVNLIYQY